MIKTEAPSEVLRGGRVKGFLAAARLRWIATYYGERTLARVLDSLPIVIAKDASQAGIAGWCQFETILALDGAILEIIGRRSHEILRDLGRFTAHLTAGRTAGPDAIHHFFRSAVLRDALFQEGARGAYEQIGPSRGRLVITAAPCFSAVWCESICGYLQQVVEIHHGSASEVAMTACRALGDQHCVFEICWQDAPSD